MVCSCVAGKARATCAKTKEPPSRRNPPECIARPPKVGVIGRPAAGRRLEKKRKLQNTSEPILSHREGWMCESPCLNAHWDICSPKKTEWTTSPFWTALPEGSVNHLSAFSFVSAPLFLYSKERSLDAVHLELDCHVGETCLLYILAIVTFQSNF